MPELPDVTIYQERIEQMLGSQELKGIRIVSPSLLKTVDPSPADFVGKKLHGVERIGKQLVFRFGRDHFLVLHLMIAGRLKWKKPAAKIPAKIGHGAFDFAPATLILTETSSHKRASLHAIKGRKNLAQFDRGGIDVMQCSLQQFTTALLQDRHTLKRAMTDQSIFSGIGNAYSDEILHRARLSPMRRTDQLNPLQIQALFDATRVVLQEWIELLRSETGSGFPDRVTAFRPQMAVHGKYGKPCPDCGKTVQRIRYASNECNYCAHCQMAGKLLADRSLSRLLKTDWPKTLEELEQRKVKK